MCMLGAIKKTVDPKKARLSKTFWAVGSSPSGLWDNRPWWLSQWRHHQGRHGIIGQVNTAAQIRWIRSQRMKSIRQMRRLHKKSPTRAMVSLIPPKTSRILATSASHPSPTFDFSFSNAVSNVVKRFSIAGTRTFCMARTTFSK